MEPAYYRGDILFVSNYNKPVVTGDVIVFKMEGEPIPIVHRALITQQKGPADQYILTKGDNNYTDDRGLYPDG
jgi:signal peptidase